MSRDFVVKKKLLFLSAYLPSPVSAQAGQKTAFRHLTWLASRYEVWFVGFRNEVDRPGDEERLTGICREVRIFPMGRKERMMGALARPGLPLLVAARWRPALAGTVREFVSQHAFDRVHCEWSQMAEYLPLTSGVPERWISAHDVVFQYCQRAVPVAWGPRQWWWRMETRRARRWEQSRGALATTILVQSTKDADLIRQELPMLAPKLRLILPYFERYRPRLRQSGPAGPVLLFWGALGRVENAMAAVWLARELMPKLLPLFPSAQLVLAGSNPTQAVKDCASEHVRVTGFVADPQLMFDEVDIAILPLFRGAGIKVKVLECLAAGLPVLTTEIGAEGIAAEQCDGLVVLPPDAAAYAGCLQRWWQKPAGLAQLSQGALNWAQRLGDGNQQILLDS